MSPEEHARAKMLVKRFRSAQDITRSQREWMVQMGLLSVTGPGYVAKVALAWPRLTEAGKALALEDKP